MLCHQRFCNLRIPPGLLINSLRLSIIIHLTYSAPAVIQLRRLVSRPRLTLFSYLTTAQETYTYSHNFSTARKLSSFPVPSIRLRCKTWASRLTYRSRFMLTETRPELDNQPLASMARVILRRTAHIPPHHPLERNQYGPSIDCDKQALPTV